MGEPLSLLFLLSLGALIAAVALTVVCGLKRKWVFAAIGVLTSAWAAWVALDAIDVNEDEWEDLLIGATLTMFLAPLLLAVLVGAISPDKPGSWWARNVSRGPAPGPEPVADVETGLPSPGAARGGEDGEGSAAVATAFGQPQASGRSRRTVVVVVAAVVLALSVIAVLAVGSYYQSIGCDADPHEAAPDSDREACDLAVPAWLPQGFPLPDSLTIRQASTEHDGAVGEDYLVLAGMAQGEAADIIAEVHQGLVADGYEILRLESDGPDVVEAMRADVGLVTVHASVEEFAVPGGAIRRYVWVEGIAFSVTIERGDDPDELRSLHAPYESSSGTAVAVIAGATYEVNGTCEIQDGGQRYEFESPWEGGHAAVDISLHVDATTDPPYVVGHVTVQGAEELLYSIYGPDAGAAGQSDAVKLSPTGFSVAGTFVDGLAAGLPQGTITVSCQ